jgi:hypothetical protein
MTTTTHILNFECARNKISFVGDKIPYYLCCSGLTSILKVLEPYFVEDANYTIQVTNLNDISITTDKSFNYLEIDFGEYTLKSLKICDSYIINNDLNSQYCDKIISRYYNTFIQTDENIRQHIYSTIMSLGNNYNNTLLIGGECYMYSSILKSNNTYVYSDYESICLDTIKNNSTAIVYQIDYNTITPNNTHIYDICILNVSKTGLGSHLCNEINKCNIKQMVYISCNERTYTQDIKNLHKKPHTRYIYTNPHNKFTISINIF